jgi:hypothetical protein
MKKIFTRAFLFLLASFLLTDLAAQVQDLTGIWRGYFITQGGEQYKFELQIEQDKNNSISGVSYSYLSTIFYGKAVLTGNYNKNSQNALVQEIKTVELRMMGGNVACIMKCMLQYVESGKEKFLEGTFTSKFEKTDTVQGANRGGDCGDGRVYLRKVITSDFYVEPFLRKKEMTASNTPKNSPLPKTTTPPVVKKAPPGKSAIPPTKKIITKTNTPISNKNIAAKKNTSTNRPDTKTNQTLTKNIPRSKVDSIKKIDINTSADDPTKKAITQKSFINTPAILKTRSNDLIRTIAVRNPEINVRLYDNGEIDDDTISVYMDKRLILSKARLSDKPLVLNLKIDDDNNEHDLVMVAENLGRIPPNTSLMIVQDGDKRYEVRISSTLQRNAMIRFHYQKEP